MNAHDHLASKLGFLYDGVWGQIGAAQLRSFVRMDQGRQSHTLAEGTQLGKYRILSLLGKGAVGEVYHALDTALNRDTALKFLQSESEETLERFLREARHQAKLEHSNICKIYEVGELEGRAFIALQYIEGVTLSEVFRGMTLEEKMVIMRDVADAIHTAHQKGLIHRDIKPANIMVRRDEAGMWKAWVMDFGLAREVAAPGMTMTGMVLGSPAYMSPEQALGEISSMDQRSDIYSLGATLYELLCGRRPFVGRATTELLIQIIEDDPRSLSQIDRNIPSDLSKITMKCLEKEQDRRYQSADQLAADLERYLVGDPVTASYPALSYRISKKILKNKTLSGVIAFGLVVVISMLGYLVTMRVSAQKQAMAIQSFGQEAHAIESLMRQVNLLPLHDITPSHQDVLARMTLIEEKMTHMGVMGEAVGHYALGRGYLNLYDYDNAKFHLQASWDAGYREADCAFYLGYALGSVYKKSVADLSGYGYPPEEAKNLTDGFKETMLLPAIGYLKAGKGADSIPDDYIQALILFYEGKNDEALEMAGAVFAERPSFYEAPRLISAIYTQEFFKEMMNHDHQKAEEASEAGREAVTAALAVARSDMDLHLRYQNMAFWRYYLSLINLEDYTFFFNDTLRIIRDGLRLTPDHPDMLLNLSTLYWHQAEILCREGEDGLVMYDLAREFATKALARGVRPARFNVNMAGINLTSGIFKISEKELKDALHYANLILEERPSDLNGLMSKMTALQQLADINVGKGMNPEAMLVDSRKAGERFLKLFNSADVHMMEVYNRICLIRWQRLNGAPDMATHQASIDAADAAVEAKAAPYTQFAKGIALLEQAVSQSRYGMDPSESFTNAREWVGKGQNGIENIYLLKVGRIELETARHLARTGGDADPAYEKAVIFLKRSYESSFMNRNTLRFLCEALLESAEWRLNRKMSVDLEPVASSVNALASFLPDKAKTCHLQAWLEFLKLRIGSGGAMAELHGLSEAALKKNPLFADHRLLLARVHQSDVEGADLAAGLKQVEAVLAVNPKNAQAWREKALLHQRLGQEGLAEEARATMIEINPLMASR